jgi:hypothetical protein
MEIERFPGGQVPMMGSFMTGHGSRTSPLNMGGIANALPDYQSPALPFSQQIPQTLENNPTLMYQLQQASQLAGQAHGQTPQYSAQYQNYPNVYQTHQGYSHVLPNPQQQLGGPGSGQGQQQFMGQQFFPRHPQQQYAAQYAQQPQPMQQRAGPYQQPFVRRSSGSYGQGPLQPEQDLRGLSGMYGLPDPGPSGTYLQPGPGPGVCEIRSSLFLC